MWCVADLSEEYIEKMEDVLEAYERPYNPAQPVVCLDEKPITLHLFRRSPPRSTAMEVPCKHSLGHTNSMFCKPPVENLGVGVWFAAGYG
jgi:hypothetical protein